MLWREAETAGIFQSWEEKAQEGLIIVNKYLMAGK